MLHSNSQQFRFNVNNSFFLSRLIIIVVMVKVIRSCFFFSFADLILIFDFFLFVKCLPEWYPVFYSTYTYTECLCVWPLPSSSIIKLSYFVLMMMMMMLLEFFFFFFVVTTFAITLCVYLKCNKFFFSLFVWFLILIFLCYYLAKYDINEPIILSFFRFINFQHRKTWKKTTTDEKNHWKQLKRNPNVMLNFHSVFRKKINIKIDKGCFFNDFSS